MLQPADDKLFHEYSTESIQSHHQRLDAIGYLHPVVDKLKRLERYEHDSMSILDYMVPVDVPSSPDSLISDIEKWSMASSKCTTPAKMRRPSLMRRFSDIRGLRGARVAKSKLRR